MEENNIKKINYKGETFISKSSYDIFILIKEAVIYKNLNYPNIPKIRHILTNNENTFEILLDVYDEDLHEYIIDPSEFKSFLKEMLLTLHYIHSKCLFHSDVKPANILHKDKKYYLIDYGLACFYGYPPNRFMYSGTPPYQGIDFKTKYDLTENDNYDLDVFSLAATCYEILTGKVLKQEIKSPYFTRDTKYKIDYNRDEIEKLIGKEGADLLHDMSGLNNRYISTKEALMHPYLNITVEEPQNIAIQENLNVKPTVIIDYEKTNLDEGMYKILVDWIVSVELDRGSSQYFQHLLSFNKLFRTLIVKNKNINTKNFQLYGIATYSITRTIFTDGGNFDIRRMINYTANSYTKLECELAIFDILNTVDWKIEMIPYKIYLDLHLKKFDFDYINESIYMGMYKILLMDLLLYDNDIKENLYELSEELVNITISYMNDENTEDFKLYNKTHKLLKYIKDHPDDMDNKPTMVIFAKYLEI